MKKDNTEGEVATNSQVKGPDLDETLERGIIAHRRSKQS